MEINHDTTFCRRAAGDGDKHARSAPLGADGKARTAEPVQIFPIRREVSRSKKQREKGHWKIRIEIGAEIEFTGDVGLGNEFVVNDCEDRIGEAAQRESPGGVKQGQVHGPIGSQDAIIENADGKTGGLLAIGKGHCARRRR